MKKQRIGSVDIFRGLTMALMTIVNNPGDWSNVYSPLLHAEWHGATPTDMVFPFFVFIMGTAMPFSMKPIEGLTKDSFVKILVRTLRIFNLGLFLNFFSKIDLGFENEIVLLGLRLIISFLVAYAMLGNFESKTKLWLAFGTFVLMIGLAFSGMEAFSDVRIPGVLQRIAMVYFFASIIYLVFSHKYQLLIGIIILLGYWLIMALVVPPGLNEGGFDKNNNIAGWLDNYLLPGHLWSSSKTWDPEGILSTLPAIVTVLLGIWVGELIKSNKEKTNTWLFVAGVVLVFLAYIWNQVFPINKALWTSSFVLLTAGWGMICLGLIRLTFGDESDDKVSGFIKMWGVNPMIVFFGSGILPRALDMIKISENHTINDFLYNDFLAQIFSSPKNASLSYAILNVLFWSIVLIFLKKRNLIFKV